jgi:hypothetical protein
MDPNLLLSVILEGLKAFNLIYADVPVEERRKAWADWCEFWAPMRDALHAGGAAK